MRAFGAVLEEIINLIKFKLKHVPVTPAYKIVFLSFAKAGLALFNATESHRIELEDIIRTEIQPAYQGLLSGELYLKALELIPFIREALESPVILKEANVQFILNFLKERVERVDGVIVLDCGSIPEISTIAGKLAYFNRKVTVYDVFFVNPAGVTRSLTGQLPFLGRQAMLRNYAELLKETLEAKSSNVISTIDLAVHRRGVNVKDFLYSLNINDIFDKIQNWRGSLLITADHGYDLVADEYGLYLTHGCRGECPLNFSKIAPFIVVD